MHFFVASILRGICLLCIFIRFCDDNYFNLLTDFICSLTFKHHDILVFRSRMVNVNIEIKCLARYRCHNPS